MIATAHVPTHTKRRCFGMAVMAMAMVRQASAQQPNTNHPSLITLAARAAALGQAGDYDGQLAVLIEVAAIEQQAAPNPADPVARQAQIDTLLDLGLRLDGAGRHADAAAILQHALELSDQGSTESHYLAQLALAHADQNSSRVEERDALCRAADPTSITTHERQEHRLGTSADPEAQKELFCGDPAKGRAMLQQELAAHPHAAAPHQVLSEYDLAIGNWRDAQQEFVEWQRNLVH